MTVMVGRFLWRIGSGIWLGTIIFFSLVVAPAIFLELPMVDAGRLLVRIFPAYYGIGLWGGGLALIGSLLAAWYASSRKNWLLFVEALLAWVLVVYANRLLGIMNHLNSASSRFAHLHGESVMINTVIGILLIVGFILETWIIRD
ncbi:DUF4149 domain-containing protein [Sulfobacillus thermosulfidooxidans]|uniref:DUF4149 domain-containing protein n=1 Tax=Sulfobacillus thermosulfidooxidans TaxID=28034 RepID=UPI0006B5895B|nr:DUF4149 domain-containing protein [Sulfobacillus thermosulfidooxidans]